MAAGTAPKVVQRALGNGSEVDGSEAADSGDDGREDGSGDAGDDAPGDSDGGDDVPGDGDGGDDAAEDGDGGHGDDDDHGKSGKPDGPKKKKKVLVAENATQISLTSRQQEHSLGRHRHVGAGHVSDALAFTRP